VIDPPLSMSTSAKMTFESAIEIGMNEFELSDVSPLFASSYLSTIEFMIDTPLDIFVFYR